jgi:outer membrane receptor protein involved in Fe transport
LSGHYQHGRSKVDTGLLNVPRIDLYFLSMDAVPDASGNPVCNISKVNPSAASLKAFMQGKRLPSPISVDGVTADSPIGPVDPATCKPFNVLGSGNANQAAVDFMTIPSKIQSRVLNQDFAEMLLSGEVYKGWGAGPVSLAVGATWRSEDFDQVNNPNYGERGVLNDPADGIRGISTGFASAGNRSLNPFSAIGVGSSEDHVSEEFAELNIPVLKLATGQTLTADVAYRSADYSNFGRTPSWKFGLDAQLFKDLRWRYSRSRDVREPNFAERYLTATGGGSVVDKATTANGTNVTNASLTVLASPNASLKNEKATTITTGFVYQPSFASWVEGVQISLDWYQISLSDALARFGAQRIADDCFAAPGSYSCGLISRDPATNVITRILDQFQNIGKAQTRGVDLETQYSFEPNWVSSLDERLTLKALVGYLSENSTTSFSGITVDAANGQDRPKYTATVSANYQVGKFGVGLFERYVGHTLLNNTWIEGVDVDKNRIASQATTNMNLSYGDKFGGKDYKLTFNVINMFNREQPIIPSTAGQVVDYNYDVFGRRFQLSLDVNF